REDQGTVGTKPDQAGGLPRRGGASRKSKNLGGRAGHRFEERHERELARVNGAQPRREHRLEPDGAGRGLGEGQALGLDILWIVIGHTTSIRPEESASTSTARSSSARSGGLSLRNVR